MTADSLALLPEARALTWREPRSGRTVRRGGWLWTAWTCWVVALFSLPGLVLLWIEPATAPVTLLCVAHAWGVPMVQARRGARSVVALGSERSSAAAGPGIGPERVALGLLGDLLDHRDRELIQRTGLAPHRGGLGLWLVGEQGAFLLHRRRVLRARRVCCWCVRVAEPGELPAADRAAHLLLALREDEEGFATVANLAFSGARWRVKRHLEAAVRPALDERGS